MGSPSPLYFIKKCVYGSRRTNGIRIKKKINKSLGIAFLLIGGYRYQECLGNREIGDDIVTLKKKKVK